MIQMIVGILLGLAGLATALMCLLALTETGPKGRPLKGLVAGLALTAAGLWLMGMLG